MRKDGPGGRAAAAPHARLAGPVGLPVRMPRAGELAAMSAFLAGACFFAGDFAIPEDFLTAVAFSADACFLAGDFAMPEVFLTAVAFFAGACFFFFAQGAIRTVVETTGGNGHFILL